MTSLLCIAFAVWLTLNAPAAAEWRADIVEAPGRVTAVETIGTDVRVAIGRLWYRISGDDVRLKTIPAPDHVTLPAGALPDSRVAVGIDKVARTWLAEATRRYRHGVLGDAIEAGALVIERRDGSRGLLRLGDDAVFEDLEPRVSKIGGAERIVVVKSYLDRGSALAVVDPVTAEIVAETTPIGHSNAWLNPAGIADFDGDGATDIALVRQPHVIGRLELWSWLNGKLRKTAKVEDVSNHVIGSRALGMSSTGDFDGDGRPDLAVPSLDRRALRLIAFTPQPHEIASVRLPARVETNIATIMMRGRLAVLFGLDTGQLIMVHD